MRGGCRFTEPVFLGSSSRANSQTSFESLLSTMRFQPLLDFTVPVLACLGLGTVTSAQSPDYDPTQDLAIGFILFPGFQPIDVVGPSDIIQGLSVRFNITTYFIWKEAGPVSARSPPRKNPPPQNPNFPPSIYPAQAPSLVATHSFSDAPPLDIILVPGGIGNRVLEENNDTAIEDFVRERYPSLKYLLTVCTGAASVAKSGLLDGRRATTNKASWAWATSNGNGVKWVPSARWVQDGNIWSSSGVAAGIDMTYAFFKMLLGSQAVNTLINGIEYTPHTNEHWDPFSVVHKVPGADTSQPLGECVGPAGYSFTCAPKSSI
ncbi:hypothetical protein RB594_006997 [Gaeumannomyces avenae]